MRSLFRKTLLLVNIAFAMLLAVTYFSVKVSPEDFWPLAFFGLAYPYILAANIVFVVLWIIRRKVYFLLSLTIIILGWQHVGNYFSLNLKYHSTPEKDNELSVLGYNIRLFNYYEWSEDKGAGSKIIEFLNEQDAGIMCLQEFITVKNTPLSEHTLYNIFGQYPYRSIHYKTQTASRVRYGIATFSKYKILQTGQIDFPNSLNMGIYSDLIFNSDTIRVYNVHLQSIQLDANDINFIDSLRLEYSEDQLAKMKNIGNRLRKAYVQRAQQVELLKAHIDGAPYPVILCGDFNDTPVSYAYHLLREGLEDAFTQSGFGIGNTYMGRVPSFRIDYILHSPVFKALYFNRYKKPYSDHYPVYGVLRMVDE